MRALARSGIPAEVRASTATEAVCYQVHIDNPRWSTQDQTRHEPVWSEWILDRVAVLRQGEWVLELGQETQEEPHWLSLGCPERPNEGLEGQPPRRPVLRRTSG